MLTTHKTTTDPPKNLRTIAIWNNKGGVGKSTLTFHISTTYAKKFPDKLVIVIDLCPQANVSSMMFGGGKCRGEDVVYSNKHPNTHKFFTTCSAGITLQGLNLPQPPMEFEKFLVKQPSTLLPDNIYLLPGSPDLAIVESTLAFTGLSNSQHATQEQNWLRVHTCLRNALVEYANKEKKEIVVFIDTNPSFAIYTAIGIVASHQLVVPIKADDSSRLGLKKLVQYIYGPCEFENGFSKLAERMKLMLPKISLIIGNQLTQYRQSAKAYKEMSSAVAEAAFKIYSEKPQIFVLGDNIVVELDDFKEKFCYELHDFNSMGVISSHYGCPLFQLKKKEYAIYQESVRVQHDQLENSITRLNEIVDKLEENIDNSMIQADPDINCDFPDINNDFPVNNNDFPETSENNMDESEDFLSNQDFLNNWQQDIQQNYEDLKKEKSQ